MSKCRYCGKELSSDTEKTKFYLNDELLFEEYCCNECRDIIQKETEDEGFGDKLVSFLKELNQNWDLGTKENSTVGSVVKIIQLKDENTDYNGRTGVIESIDGIGQLHGTWGGLAIIPEVDNYLIMKKVENNSEKN